ncbi:hypothetical protein MOV08_15905 [Streptomyces yunnanensis]|uniref:SnoaL-like domain-containing protein n=1 Tax=Streptomyces yunnanensis TaxID=156453 RepID=A0ABY8A9M1_9ACTN|nr:hypothetical protein [Streptomyces yunnanensis]WEB40620.1 hypothetical protein MOV08_15905 [Streptomyces yunnanensis]
MKTRWRANALLVGVSVAVAGLLASGCSEDVPDARPLPKGTGGVTASRAPATGETEALDAYRAMWRDLTRASLTSDADSPLLEDHATSGALELMKHGLRKSKHEGVVSKGAPRVDPHVVSASSQEVVLVDCVDDRNWLLYKQNGELKNNVPGGHLKTDATVRRADGVWKVSNFYMHETGSC